LKGDNQNELPYVLLGIVKGYIVEGGIDLEQPASTIFSIERFNINFFEDDKVFFLSQETKICFFNFKDFLNPWLTQISNTKTSKYL
jgi:uncharacterized pyridoxamine 5'-phosphate oxidase family protein